MEQHHKLFVTKTKKQIINSLMALSRSQKDKMLIYCCYMNYLYGVEIILKAGANINTSNTQCMTPLMICSRYGYLEIVKILLKYDANINRVSLYYNKTALEYANDYNHIKIRNILLKIKYHNYIKRCMSLIYLTILAKISSV